MSFLPRALRRRADAFKLPRWVNGGRPAVKARALAAAAAVALTVPLAACDGPPPKSGYVKKLAFYDRWTETIYTQLCVVYGKYGCMAYETIETGHVEHPPQWCLLLVDDKDRKHEGEVCVPPETYAKYQVGMHYPDAR